MNRSSRVGEYDVMRRDAERTRFCVGAGGQTRIACFRERTRDTFKKGGLGRVSQECTQQERKSH